jgi:type I restriction enzyme S subunit
VTATQWEKATLGDYFHLKHGFAFKGEFFANSGSYILLTPGNFRRDGGLEARGEREKYYIGEFPSNFLLKEGDLLIVLTDLTQNAPILGSPAIIPVSGKYLHNQRLGKVVKLDESKLKKKFLYYLLNTANVREQIKATATGSTVRHTAPERIYSVRVSVPDLPSQQRIVDILSAYDDLIENNTRRIKILEQMAQMLYREWFVNFQFPGNEKVRMVESDMGTVPDGWPLGILRDVCSSVDYGYTASAVVEPVGPKLLRITDIVPDTIDWNSVPHCSISPEKRDKYRLTEGDIVIARTGATTGYAKRLNKKHPDCVFASYLVRLRMKSEHSNHAFGLLVESDDYKRFITANLGGAAQPQANAQVLTSLPVAIPPTPLQQRFSSIVEPMLDEREVLQSKNMNLRSTRDLLLPKLVSGEISVEKTEVEAVAEMV